MRKSAFLILALLAMLGYAPVAVPADVVLRVRDGKVISFTDLFNDMRKADIVFVGELHDSVEDHAHELDVIRSLHYADIPMAIGLEMFEADSQNDLDGWVSGRLPLDRFLPDFYRNWRFPWPYYRAIFEFAREHGIPMVGLNVPQVITEKVARSGFASLTVAERRQLPPGISCNVDPTYMEFIRRAYRMHGTGGEEKSFIHFCEAQMVWDKAMAWHIMEYLKRNEGKKLVVLSGVGHAWKRGIPEQVAELSKHSLLVILPAIAEGEQDDRIRLQDADYLFR